MRIRQIKPEFWDDELVASWPHLSRLVYIGLWNVADDKGRLRASTQYLHGKLFPYEEVDLGEAIKPIVESGRLVLYTVNGTEYGVIPRFPTHQKQSRSLPSKIPPPPNEILVYENTCGCGSGLWNGDGNGDGKGDTKTKENPVGVFCEEYKSFHHKQFVMDKTDAKHCWDQFKSLGKNATRWRALCRQYVKDPDQFVARQGWPPRLIGGRKNVYSLPSAAPPPPDPAENLGEDESA